MNIIIFILVLGVNILIHEFAHFYFARKANILCHEFAIGMGPVIYQKKQGETLYSIRAIPLGGYVSMAGEEIADFVKKDNTVGINIDEEGKVTEIILNNETKYDYIGKVIDSDLYGADDKELFITLLIAGKEARFLVNKDAMYVFKPKKKMQLSIAERSFENKTLWERFKVVIAGPLSNFLLAFIILFVLAFFIGKPSNNTKIGGVSENALNSGINVGDEITKVDGKVVNNFSDISQIVSMKESNKNNVLIELNGEKEINMPLYLVFQGLGFTNVQGNDELVIGEVFGRNKNLQSGDVIQEITIADNLDDVESVKVNSWDDLINCANENSVYENVRLVVLRYGSQTVVEYGNIPVETLNKLNASYVGFSIGIEGTREFNLLYPLYYPFLEMGNSFNSMFNTIGLLISPNTGVGVGDLAGPVGIYSLVSDAVSGGAAVFFVFVAFLSVNIGFINLLPIPALDGGRIVFIIYEAITKRKVNKNVENIMITITFILLLILMVFVTFQDITRLFR